MRWLRTAAVLVAGAATLIGCDDTFVVPDLNNPGLESLESNATAAAVIDATQGLMIGARAGHTGQISTTSHLGMLGRESLVFDNSDPRYIDEMLAGNLDAGNGAFGGFGWTPRYANLRNANVVLNALEALPEGQIDEPGRAALRGFAKTIMALDFYWVAMLRYTNGLVIDVNRPFGAELAPFVTLDEGYAEIERLLDEADADLSAASAFPFNLSSGFEDFDTPGSFRQATRALKARVHVLQGEYTEALVALADTWVAHGDLDRGVAHAFSTNAGDATNDLFQGASPTIVAHSTLAGLAESKSNGDPDDRFRRKVGPLSPRLTDPRGVSSNLRFLHYPALSSPLPIIRTEELLLLRAEALWFTGARDEAMSDLNFVRTTSGGLDPIATPAGDEAFIDALLYERLFSLLFEGGFRWIDMRRFDRLDAQIGRAHV